MRIIRCKDCNTFFSVKPGYKSVCMCFCGHTYYCVDTHVVRPNKVTGKNQIYPRRIWIYGPCDVFFVNDDELDAIKPGETVQMQLTREPHPNVVRVNKDKILWKDRGK